MNMERVKTIVIVCLVFINITFASLLFVKGQENNLTQSQSDAILHVLKQNHINMYTSIPIEYKPMKRLEIAPYEMGKEEALGVFFGSGGKVTETGEFSETVYVSGSKTLTVSGNSYLFTNPDGSGAVSGDTDAIFKACDDFIKKIKIDGVVFERDRFFNYESEYNIIEYRARYKGVAIYPCYIRFTVTELGIVRIRCLFSTPIGYAGEAREIYSADEALFQLMFRLKDDYGDIGGENVNSNITIVNLDLVYHLDEAVSGTGESQNAAPYYRFYIRPGNTGQILSEPYLINAYNNTILNY